MSFCTLCSSPTLDMMKHIKTFAHQEKMREADQVAAARRANAMRLAKNDDAPPASALELIQRRFG